MDNTSSHTHSLRRASILAAAGRAGLLEGERGAIGARPPKQLLAAAKESSGLASTTEVIEYALAKLALEDDFGERLLGLKSSVTQDLDLEF